MCTCSIPGPVLSILTTYFVLTILCGRHCYPPHFTGEEMEAQRGKGTGPRSQSWEEWHWGWQLDLFLAASTLSQLTLPASANWPSGPACLRLSPSSLCWVQSTLWEPGNEFHKGGSLG